MKTSRKFVPAPSEPFFNIGEVPHCFPLSPEEAEQIASSRRFLLLIAVGGGFWMTVIYVALNLL